MWNEDHLMLVQ